MAKGHLKLIVNPMPEPIWSQAQEHLSIRTEDNTQDITFDYDNLNPTTINSMQVLYQEGFPTDFSQTYIVIASQATQSIGTGAGTVELHVVSRGIANQLDKIVTFNIGSNTVTMAINFESRPDTLDIIKTTSSYTIPIPITKQDILNHFSDFDGNTIVRFGVETNGDLNFKYGGAQYNGPDLLDIATVDSVGFIYYPDANPLGYTASYLWIAEDETGLITKA